MSPSSLANTSARGFSLVELLLVLGLLGLATTMVLGGAWALSRRSSDFTLLSSEATRLNAAAAQFKTGGGTIDATDTATSVLLKLQTPLDDNTVKATGNPSSFIALNYDLQPYTASDGAARLIWSSLKYSVVTNGSGYRPVHLHTPKNLAPVSRTVTGASFGVTSKWVWEFSTPDAVGGTSRGGIAITGPANITTAGTYSWTATSSLAGTITLTLRNGQSFSAVGTTLSQASAFNAGDSFTFTVVAALSTSDPTQANSAVLPVTVNIPVTALTVIYGREDGTTSTQFSYAQVSSSSTTPSIRDGIVLSAPGSPAGVSLYYTYDGSDPTAASHLYTGPFHVPLTAWSSSISLKAVAISTVDTYKSGPVLALALTPLQVPLTAPTFSPVSGSTITESAPVYVVPNNTATDSPRTAINTTPTIFSSTALTFTFPAL